MIHTQTPDWVRDATMYHLYPLGTFGAEKLNNGPMQPQPRIRSLADWLPHLKTLNINTILLGPVWNSESHGYDTMDLTTLDPRLGTNDDLEWAIKQAKDAGFRVIFDAVLNHVGRRFFGFRDVQEQREASRYRTWFSGLEFNPASPTGDGIDYHTWDGHYSLIKLRMDTPEVREYLLTAVESWIRQFDIDGIRLDAADVIDPAFWPRLRDRTCRMKPEFWLYGEQVFGDYRAIAGPAMLHGATNYECYKGFWSSANDGNMHEIAYALERQFVNPGIYRGLSMVNFLDNHDVPRIASKLQDPSHLYPLHIMLGTLPGVPTVYYGSEFGLQGEKAGDDWPLRPQIAPEQLATVGSHGDLYPVVSRLLALRRKTPALTQGSYLQVAVGPRYLVYLREYEGQQVLVAVSIASDTQEVRLPLEYQGEWDNLLDLGDSHATGIHSDSGLTIPGNWGCILTRRV